MLGRRGGRGHRGIRASTTLKSWYWPRTPVAIPQSMFGVSCIVFEAMFAVVRFDVPLWSSLWTIIFKRFGSQRIEEVSMIEYCRVGTGGWNWSYIATQFFPFIIFPSSANRFAHWSPGL